MLLSFHASHLLQKVSLQLSSILTSKVVVVAALCSSLLGVTAVSAAPAETDKSTVAVPMTSSVMLEVSAEKLRDIKAAFKRNLPNIPVVEVAATPMPGIYQATMQTGEVVYTNESARHLLSGELFSLENGKLNNLTEVHRSSKRVSKLASLDKSKMVTFKPAGESISEVYVFTDTDCGYCRKFHEEVAGITKQNVTVHYLAWPRAGVNSATAKTLTNIWCSKDPQGAMTLAKQGKSIPQSDCETPIEAHLDIGRQLGVRGTPAVFAADGRQLGGYVKASDLVTRLTQK